MSCGSGGLTFPTLTTNHSPLEQQPRERNVSVGLLRVRRGHPGSDLLPDYNPDHIILQIGDLYHASSVLRHVPYISRDPSARAISLCFASITASFIIFVCRMLPRRGIIERTNYTASGGRHHLLMI